MIVVESKRKNPATILKKYPDAILADVISDLNEGKVELSLFNTRCLFPMHSSRIVQ